MPIVNGTAAINVSNRTAAQIAADAAQLAAIEERVRRDEHAADDALFLMLVQVDIRG